MKRKILIWIIVFLMMCSLFPFAMLIHGSEIETIDYVTESEYVEVSNHGYVDPLLNTSPIPFTKASSYQPYFVQSEVGKQFFNGYDQQMYGNDVKKVIDLSEHNGTVDFEKILEAGVDGVILRAGWGAGGIDKKFDQNIKECNRLGIPYGIYLYSYAYDANFAYREAISLIELLNQYDLSYLYFPIYYDLEDFTAWFDGELYRYPPQSVNTYNEIVKTFVEAFETAGYHQLVHVYSYRSKLYSSLNSAYIHSLTSWVAEYNPSLAFSNTYYHGDSGWQYTSSATMEGISTLVDMNVFSNYVLANVNHVFFPLEQNTLILGQNKKLNYAIHPHMNHHVQFQIDDPSICSIDQNGNLIPKQIGTTSITMVDGHEQCKDSMLIHVEAICPPTNIQFKQISEDDVLLSWDICKEATAYEVYLSKNQAKPTLLKTVDPAINQFQLNDIDLLDDITIYIKTIVNEEKSVLSKPTTIKLALYAPEKISYQQKSISSIQLQYSAVANAQYYDIYRATSKNGKYYKMVRTSKTTYTHSSLTPCQEYYYRIRSVNGDHKSVLTKPILIKTKLATPSLQVSKSGNKARIVIGTSKSAPYYQIYCRKPNTQSFRRVLTLKATHLTYDHKLSKKGTYEYKVRCYRLNRDGIKQFSSFSAIKKVILS